MQSEVLRVPEVAQMLGISESRAYQLVKANVIPCVKWGRSLRVPRLAFEAWLEEQKTLAMGNIRRDSSA